MTNAQESSPHQSLLASLIEGGSVGKAWPVFAEKYGRLIHGWGMRWGASAHEAEGFVQETLITIFNRLETYKLTENSSFRSLLRKVVFRCWLRIFEARGNLVYLDKNVFVSNETLDRLAQPQARDDLLNCFERMALAEIIALARQRVIDRVEPSTWRCFELMNDESISAAEVADILGMKASAVLMACWRVRTLIREEIRKLDPEHDRVGPS